MLLRANLSYPICLQSLILDSHVTSVKFRNAGKKVSYRKQIKTNEKKKKNWNGVDWIGFKSDIHRITLMTMN